MTKDDGAAVDRLSRLSTSKAKLLEALIEKQKRERPQFTRLHREQTSQPLRLPASAAQARLWLINQFQGGGRAYHIPMSVRLRGTLDREALQRAFDVLVRRHESLRTVFSDEDGGLMQVISPEARFGMEFIDLRCFSEGQQRAEVGLRRSGEAQSPFDLRAGPLIRGQLLQLQAKEHLLLLTAHHIIFDGWSMRVLVREVEKLYTAYQAGREISLEPLQLQYSDYSHWQRQWVQGDALQRQLSYWREHLKGAPPQLELPTDRPRPAVHSYRGASVRVPLGTQLSVRVKHFAEQHRLTLFMVMYAASAILLSRLSGQEDLLIGTPIANRQSKELEGIIGFFVNTLVLRTEPCADKRVTDFLQEVKRVTLDGYDRQEVPFDQVVEALQPTRSLSRNPLFQVMVDVQSTQDVELRLPGLASTLEVRLDDTAKFDLLLIFEDNGAEITVDLSYATDLFDAATVERWMTSLTILLKGMMTGLDERIGDLPILTEHERYQLIEHFNHVQPSDSPEQLIHELFEEQVERRPDAIAVSFGEQTLSYAELNGRANQLAHFLIENGVRPDQLIALCVERSFDLVIGVLGILKAGAAYVPLDANYPPERLHYMLVDAAPRLLLTQGQLRKRLAQRSVSIVALDDDWDKIAQASTGNPNKRTSGLLPHHLAYVIYTSGSTGKPKGVMVEHRNVTRLFSTTTHWFEFGPRDVWTLFHSFAFDFSVWELWGALFYGGRVVMVPHLTARAPQEFYRLLCEQGVTILNQTPSAFAQLIDAQASSPSSLQHSLRLVIFGGEALELHTLQPWVKRNGTERPQLVNMYGITETTVHVTYRRLTGQDIEAERGSLIGRPIPDLKVYVLGRTRQPVPLGVTGEMYVGGAGVARGYLNRPELTAERFIKDPFSGDARARLYRTGDLGRWRSDGTLEYLGRNDDQVKIRGFRIELGEIEAQLVRDERVKDAVVITREDVPGEKRLVAYVVPVDPSGATSVDDLRRYLMRALPEYMVPSAFVMLERLPLTTNGKLDRHALPPPERNAYASRQYERPHGDVEEILAGIWQTLLSVERVGRQDNFFELGGHSLLIVQLMERLRRVGLAVEVRRVFESSTLAELASALTSEAAEQFEAPPNLIPVGCTIIEPQMLPLAELEAEYIDRIVASVPGGVANVKDIYPLAPLQEGILFHHLLNEQGGDIYVLPSVLCVSSRARLEQLIAAMQAVLDRHDVLRTAVLWEHLPRPMQVVYRSARLPVHEVELTTTVDAMNQVKEWLRPERQKLDLRQAPLMRLQVAEDKESGEWYALWQLHHILDDATSLRLVISEVIAHMDGYAQRLPAPVPYRNHVAHALAYARKHDAETFFRSKLGDIAEPTAPFGLLDVHGDGSNILEARESLDADLARRLREHARRLSVSAATLFHVAWALVVAHTSGREDIVFGSVLLGRLQGTAGAQRTIGMFINTLPLRLQLQGVTVRALVEQTQRELVELLGHEQASLAVAQRCSSVAGSAPLFTALLNYRHSAPNMEADWSRSSGIRIVTAQERTNYPVTMSVDDLGEGFMLTALTDQRIDPGRVTGYLHTAAKSLVRALEYAQQAPALSLTILPDHERRQLIESLNATQVVYDSGRRVHELFEDQVRRTPTVEATVHGQQALTYAELNRKANQLARYLQGKGVCADTLVGMCVERSLDMVVGLLAILKAGGAYLPLDPNYPKQRLQYMLEDATPKVVLTQDRLKASMLPTASILISLDAEVDALQSLDAENFSPLELGVAAANLVYVIYTSGSTGRPKGTAMCHRAMLNLLEWHRRDERLGEARRVLQFATLSFDVAFQEIFSTLCTGGTLVLIDEWVRKDANALIQLLQTQTIERLFLPPLMLQSLADCCNSLDACLPSLRDVIAAGEQLRLSPEIVSFFARLKGCRLHNHYGPTETHVVTALQLSGEPSRWPMLPAIGRPISNTQIYILDGRKQPLPIGVVGEIYIGGASLARGYMNRGELTAERFVADPFKEDSHGRLYHTGDLGRWRADGTIEYLGRNDDQVKIRGFRIEFGEVEQQLARHEQVKAAAVALREDVPGQSRLVAYVAPLDQGRPPSIEDLREHLRSALPEYMVPSAFVLLESLPLTSSGKLNRRALPAPKLDAYNSREYEPAQGHIEETLADIWQSVLHVDRVGRNDNFFELGGHSLLVLSVLFRINRALGVELRVSDIYRSPTVSELAQRVLIGEQGDKVVDLALEARLPDEIVAKSGAIRSPAKTILLTGATGFVGRFMLAQLLEDEQATIYCLVRAPSRDQAAARLSTTLKKWDLLREHLMQRIVVVAGDLRLPRLGVDESTYRTLCQSIDAIYHCGASMNHLETYTTAKPANVTATIELLKLATEQRPKVINYISTLGIFTPDSTQAEKVVDELSPIENEKHFHSQGYAASKWVGEKILLTAAERGIPCNIFRLGLVWADSRLGRYDDMQREYRILKSCLLSGVGIREYRYNTMPIAVDDAARAVVFLASSHPLGHGIFHISAPGQISEGLYERCNEIPGIELRLMSLYEWICHIRRLHQQGQSLPVVPLFEFAFSMDEQSFAAYERNWHSRRILVDCARTRSELAEAGIVPSGLTDELLATCIESLRMRDAEVSNSFNVEGRLSPKRELGIGAA